MLKITIVISFPFQLWHEIHFFLCAFCFNLIYYMSESRFRNFCLCFLQQFTIFLNYFNFATKYHILNQSMLFTFVRAIYFLFYFINVMSN